MTGRKKDEQIATTRRTLLLAGALGLGMSTLAPRISFAQDFPTRPIQIMYPFAPGGGMDVVLRAMATDMEKALGQPLVIDNRPGAGAAIAAQAAARAAPDGYTLLVAPTGIMAITPHLRKLAFAIPDDFEAVAALTAFSGIVAVSAHLPVNTFDELIAYAKANPGKVSYATSGIGSQGHLNGEMFQKKWGISLMHVPYKGIAEAIPDLLSGNVSMSSDVTLLQFVKEGKIKLLAVSDDKPLADYPNVPAIGRLNGTIGTWFGAFAPKGTPRPVIDKLAAAFQHAVNDPAMESKMRPFSIRPAFLGPDEFRKVWLDEFQKYGALIKELNMEVK